MKLVIVGLGSIGKRHQKNLQNLGHIVIPCHQNDDLKTVIKETKPDGVIICNPTSEHIKTALAASQFNLPLLIEKPLSHNLNNTDKLTGNILVGYCLRFDQSLKEFKNQIDKLNKKEIKSVKIVCQSWLPDWRAKSDYRKSYSAKKDLGGGVLLDLSHEIDYALWFFGPIKSVKGKLTKAENLKIETEAIADLDLQFKTGVKANIYLSYADRSSERYCEVVTNSQVLRWDYQPNNEMYVEEMKHFINIIKGKQKPLVTVKDGVQVLRVIKKLSGKL